MSRKTSRRDRSEKTQRTGGDATECRAARAVGSTDIEWVHPPVGERGMQVRWLAVPQPRRSEAIDASDATLFGSTSGPSAPALMYLRWGRQTYANVRPARWRPGYRSPLAHPEHVDLGIVRENLEDMYMGIEGDVETLAPLELQSRTARRKPLARTSRPGRYAMKLITEAGYRARRALFVRARPQAARARAGPVASPAAQNTTCCPTATGIFEKSTERVARETIRTSSSTA